MLFKFEDNHFLIYEHNEQDNIPFDGWFHNCIFCGSITALEVKFNHKAIDVNILCCKDCNKFEKIEKYKNSINKWIEENIIKTRGKFFVNDNNGRH